MRILTFCFIICLLVILVSSNVQSQSIDTLVCLYPLHIGDIWQYDWRNLISNPSFHISYETWEITYDTIMPNGKKYFVINNNRYHRMDTSTGIVYFWGGNNDNILFDLNHSGSQHIDTIFGVPVFAVWNGPIGQTSELAYGFGIVTQNQEGSGWPEQAKLIYAKINGIEYGIPVSVSHSTTQPIHFDLFQNYPNPFNNSVVINYTIPRATDVTLKIYDVLGQEVAVLVNERKLAGEYHITWNAEGVPSGVYFYRMVAGEFVETKKMVMMK